MKEVLNTKSVKTIATSRYRVELFVKPDGCYFIKSQKKTYPLHTSEDIRDFKTASFLFDAKVLEFDGN